MGVDYSEVELLLSVYDLRRALHMKNIYFFYAKYKWFQGKNTYEPICPAVCV